MKLKKVGSICAATGRYYLFDVKDSEGNVTGQWLGDGCAVYPLEGMPYMEMENVCAMYDLTEKKQEKSVLRHQAAPEAIGWEDTDPTERLLEDPKLCIRYDGREMLPLETSQGIVFIDEKYLAPLNSTEYMRLYERRTRDGNVYIAAKIALLVQAVIMPVDAVNEALVAAVSDLETMMRAALLKKRTYTQKREDAGVEGQSELFQVDKETGEVIDFPGAEEETEE